MTPRDPRDDTFVPDPDAGASVNRPGSHASHEAPEGLRTPGFDPSRISPAHRRQIAWATPAVTSDEWLYIPPSWRAVDYAIEQRIAYRLAETSRLMALLPEGVAFRRALILDRQFHADGCKLLVNSADEVIGCVCGVVQGQSS